MAGSTGYYVNGTVTFEVPVNFVTGTLVDVHDQVFEDARARLRDGDLDSFFVHSDHNAEPYELDGPEYD